jgi:hypothetical protein
MTPAGPVLVPHADVRLVNLERWSNRLCGRARPGHRYAKRAGTYQGSLTLIVAIIWLT